MLIQASSMLPQRMLVASIGLSLSLAFSVPASAHCDTLAGPVVTAAREALASGDPVPLLRWVQPSAEAEMRAAFARARVVRDVSPEARELADRWFFETAVRLHRQGEGLPYSGLAPPDTPVAPAVTAVDAALASGSADRLARQLAADVEREIRDRFEHLLAARAHADESVERGREMVAAYVALTHFAERIGALIGDEAPAHGPAVEPEHASPAGKEP